MLALGAIALLVLQLILSLAEHPAIRQPLGWLVIVAALGAFGGAAAWWRTGRRVWMIGGIVVLKLGSLAFLFAALGTYVMALEQAKNGPMEAIGHGIGRPFFWLTLTLLPSPCWPGTISGTTVVCRGGK